MERENLRVRLDEGLARAHAELEGLPGEYTEENWERHRDIVNRIRSLSDTKARFARVRAEPDQRDKVWRELLY